MPNLADAVQVLFPNSVPLRDWKVTQPATGAPFISFWNPAIGVQPSQAQISAVTQLQVDALALSNSRSAALAIFLTDKTISAQVLRAVAIVLLDQVNTLEQQIQQLRNDARAVAPSIPAVSYPQYTTTDLRNAVQAKINSGASD